jgi:hypothetical protein
MRVAHVGDRVPEAFNSKKSWDRRAIPEKTMPYALDQLNEFCWPVDRRRGRFVVLEVRNLGSVSCVCCCGLLNK